MKTIVAILLALLLAADALACGRCGHSYCHGCYVKRYVAPIVHKVVTPIVQTPNIFVVQNSYPQPLVGQGTTGYSANFASYQQGVLPFLDPNNYFAQEMGLAQAASAAASLRADRTAALFERVVAIQAPAIERLSAGQAAQMVLQAAGLDVRGRVSGQRSAVVVTHDEYGNPQVRPLNEQEANQAYSQYEDGQGDQGGQQQNNGGGYPLVTQFCGRCHGQEVASPAGGFYIGDTPEIARVMQDQWWEITTRVTSKNPKYVMPKPEAPQPNEEQKGQILNELEQIIFSQTGERP